MIKACRLAPYGCLLLAALAGQVSAASIPPAYQRVAEENGIPAAVLYALALTESSHISPFGPRPWPWTLNIEGKSQFFETRREAEKELTRVLEQGVTNVDIGLLQINWRAHGEKLGDPRRALDPYHNLRTGARILRDCLDSAGNMWRAVGRYHSGTEALAAAYRDRFGRNLLALLASRSAP